jgi:hypothetical protein
MKLGTTTHPKFRRLQKQLKLPSYAAAGLLEMLWMLASQYADDGDLTRFTPQEIADYCDYEGDADSLLEALVACKWLDRDADSLRIHDWFDHRSNYLQDRDRKRAERAGKREDSCDSPDLSRTVQDSPGKSSPSHSQAKPSQALAMPNHAKPSQALAMPNHAKPSQALAMPNHAKPSPEDSGGDAGGGRADLDFLRLGENQYRDVMRQSVAINNCFGKQIDSSELLWQLAWVGFACSEGVIPGCIEKFKKLKGTKDAVKSPQAWLVGCINRELKNAGITFEDAAKSVVPFSEVKALV